MKQLDWAATADRASRMTDDELIFAIADCIKAGLAALDLERAGHRVTKSQGYYSDEGSVYYAEQKKRKNSTLTSGKVKN